MVKVYLMKRSFIAKFKILSPVFLLCFSVLGFLEASSDSLPHIEEILEKVRENLRSDRYLLRNYTYNESQEILEMSKKGDLKNIRTMIYEIFPSAAEEITYRRLVSKNGNPVSKDKLLKQDRKHKKHVQKYAQKAQKRGLSVQSVLEMAEEEALYQEEQALNEMFLLYQFKVQGSDFLEGNPTLIVTFTPRPDFKVKTKHLKPLKKICGRVWINQNNYQLVRIEAKTLSNLHLGWGIISKLNKGANMSFQRRKVNDEIWLPAESFFQGTGRILIFKGFRFEVRTKYSQYKKFSVGTSSTLVPE